MATPELNVIQKWMMSVITHPSGIEAGIVSQPAQEQLAVSVDQLEAVIPRSLACTSVERLAVYGNAFFARLIECLESEFPAVLNAVGRDAFRSFAGGYIQHSPPASYTLNQLGAKFPGYLQGTKPASGLDRETSEWMDFVIDLAKLERLYSEVFDGPGEEKAAPFTAETIQRVHPDRWGEVRIRTTSSLRLFTSGFPVHDDITAVRHQAADHVSNPDEGFGVAVPQRVPTWLIVSRRDYVVRRQPVSEMEWRLLSALQENQPLENAIESAMSGTTEPVEHITENLTEWFRRWTSTGILVGIDEEFLI